MHCAHAVLSPLPGLGSAFGYHALKTARSGRPPAARKDRQAGNPSYSSVGFKACTTIMRLDVVGVITIISVSSLINGIPSLGGSPELDCH